MTPIAANAMLKEKISHRIAPIASTRINGMTKSQQSAFDLRDRMEPDESREQSGKTKESLVESEITPLPSAKKELPTVIVDPSFKVEADQVEEKKRGRRRSKRPRGQLSQAKGDVKSDNAKSDKAISDNAKSDKNESARPSEALSAVEAERYASSIRPSWDSLPARKSGDSGRLGVSIEHAADSRNQARGLNPEIAAAGTPLQIPYNKFSKQYIFWAGGAVAAVGLLLTLIISTSNSGSVVDGAKKRLWKDAPRGSTQSAQIRHPEKQAIARNDLPRTSLKEALKAAPKAAPAPVVAPVKDPTPPQAQASSPAKTAAAPSAPTVQEAAPKTAPVVEAKVRIRVETSPRDAQLYLDGALVGNPFDSRVALSNKHQFEARLDGFNSTVRTVDFDQDRLVYLSLSKVQTQAVNVDVSVNKANAPRRAIAQSTSRKAVKRATKQAEIKPPKSPTRSRASSPKSLGAGFVSTNPY
jgi:hypothetical protein